MDTREYIKLVKDKLLAKLQPLNDYQVQQLSAHGRSADLIYVSSICDLQKLETAIIQPFRQIGDSKAFLEALHSSPQITPYQDVADALQQMLSGSAVLLLEEAIYMVAAQKELDVGLNETTVETTLQGPQYGLSENLATSLQVIRSRYQAASLHLDQYVIGRLSRTQVAVMYDTELVDQQALQLEELKLDMLQAVGQLENALTKQKRVLIPRMLITQRQDRAAFALSKGQIVILLDGTSFVLIAPCTFLEFFQSMDDLYLHFWISRSLLLLRYIGLLTSLTLPALYTALTSYNPEIFRVQFALTIAGSRAAVPYPSYLEVSFMLLMMELITESSIRLPKAIGPTATTVGGLILGQAAAAAGLVSNIMIIIVAAVALANFVIPINSMSFAVRIIKYLLLIAGSMYGLIGIIGGLVLAIFVLTDIRSYGKPYLQLFSNTAAQKRDVQIPRK
ncbi:spore germination protein [Ectobacillus ponti]|uniref:Spore germination protein n=1 Tax=Ectobacillus ponti TaxID=2961894 RepID=A0AA41X4X2_9BACI|nr:spore germination protein [Ectobacillus ponti]MCP8967248.1 spore germination protein [Ectobacillus ponti]